MDNYRNISDIIGLLLRKYRGKKFFLIGDLNLNEANWLLNTSSNSIEQAFLDEFVQASLIQLINESTHINRLMIRPINELSDFSKILYSRCA